MDNYTTDEDGVLIGLTRPVYVCSECGPQTLAVASRVIRVVCKRCLMERQAQGMRNMATPFSKQEGRDE